jgi:hypothetical protein
MLVTPPMRLEFMTMKSSLRICTFLFLAASASAALAQQSSRGPNEDRYCAEDFAKSQASLTCTLTAAKSFPGGICHINASCAASGGATKPAFYAGSWTKVQNLCNRDGSLVVGCAPL